VGGPYSEALPPAQSGGRQRARGNRVKEARSGFCPETRQGVFAPP